MDDIVPAAPQPKEIAAGAPPRVETPREHGQTSINAPPPREEMRRDDTRITMDELVDSRTQSLCEELHDRQTYINCLKTCVFFCCIYALINLVLNITICCKCCTCLLKIPKIIEEQTARTHKVVAFFARLLSSLWVSALLALFAQWVLFRPIDVKPHLAASTVHQFELTSTGDLRFNLTTYVLFHNGHSFYKIRYDHFAASVLYADVKIGTAAEDEMPSFRQKPHESTLQLLPFMGRLRNAAAGGTVEETLAGERAEGLLQMIVRIRVYLIYGFWPFKGKYLTNYDCPLHSPFPQMGGGEPAVSSPARCNTVHV